MPCVSGPTHYDMEKAYSEIDRLTRLLCEVMTKIEDTSFYEKEFSMVLLSDEVRAWWTQHKIFDKKRKAQELERKLEEEQKAIALAKLTYEDKKALKLL